MVLPKGDLGDLVRQVQNAGHAVLPIVHLLFLRPEILANTVDLSLRTFHKSHPLVCNDACSVRVQRRHHDCWRSVIVDALIRAFLLHQSSLEIFCCRPLHR